MSQNRHLRILLVDDEPDILFLLQAMLKTSAWEVVGKATGGEEALRLASEFDFDVAIIDYMMPGMHGLELAARVKKGHPDCDVVLFSAYDVRDDAEANPNVDHFLAKTEVGSLDGLLKAIAKAKGIGPPGG